MNRFHALCGLIIGCFFSSILHAAGLDCGNNQCVAVVDMGSTGSRLHVYSYQLNKQNAPDAIREVLVNKVQPGIASVDIKNVNSYLNSLFSTTPAQNIPVYVYATAGMRLLSQPKQQLYYQSLKTWFSSQTAWVLQDAKTISGKQEGILGWLAANYQLGTLQSEDKPLVGVMDMGGGSVQIAFPTEHPENVDSRDMVQFKIYNRQVTLFVHSFLGLGQTEVSHHYLNAEHCFPYDYPLPDESKGQGDAQYCQQDISDLINSVHKVKEVVGPALSANPNVTWYALSGLSSLAKNKLFKFEGNQFNSQGLLQQADQQFCHQSWQVLIQQSGSNDYTFINCLNASYYYSLLVNGYGIQPTKPLNLMSEKDEVDWTLGVVLQSGVPLVS